MGVEVRAMCCDEFIQTIIEEYSKDSIAKRLEFLGLLGDRTIQYSGDMKKFIFLQSNTNEVYSNREIEFVKQIENIVIFSDFLKETKRGSLACRTIAANLSGQLDALLTAVEFEKIMNKAIDGFNIFFLVTDNGLHFGCSVMGTDSDRNYDLTLPIKCIDQYMEMEQNLIFAPYDSDFTRYYWYLHSIFQPPNMVLSTYDEKVAKMRQSRSKYLESLQYIANILKLDVSREIERYEKTFENTHEKTFRDCLDDIDVSLFEIKSSRINTLELLYEAEEAKRQADETERCNVEILSDGKNDVNFSDVDERMIELLKEPENLIKLLKKQKGIR